jgi:Protein of unknown function (DUF2652)
MATKGYFIITDISGYTEYLTKSELEHAHAIMHSLFDAQLAHIKFPLHVSGFAGDAILMYVPEAEFMNPQSLVEVLENVYIAFSETLQQMILNTTCTCNACKNIKLLDLKAVVHYGEYMIQQLGNKHELLGADVIVPHRLLKNHVIEKTGVKAYAIFSEAAANKLHLQNLCDPLIPHTEEYEHIGEVQIHVHNLRAAWQNYLDEMRYVVNPNTAWIKIELDIPFPPSLIWDYVTTPELEAHTLGLLSVIREDEAGGRTRPGAQFHCTHVSTEFIYSIVDWKPFKYYTVKQSGLAGLEYYRTITMDYDGNTTKFGVYFSEPESGAPPEVRDFLANVIRESYERVHPTMQAGIESGKFAVQ